MFTSWYGMYETLVSDPNDCNMDSLVILTALSMSCHISAVFSAFF